MNDNIRETALAAITVLEEDGWIQGAWQNRNGRCLYYAIQHATDLVFIKNIGSVAALLYSGAATVRRAGEVIKDLYPHERYNHCCLGVIAAFNDHPDTTLEDVVLVLKTVAERQGPGKDQT